jgi:hypothetical protein
MKTPWKPSHVHCHLDVGCIQAADSMFLPSSLVFPGSVKLYMQKSHKDKVMAQFGLVLSLLLTGIILLFFNFVAQHYLRWISRFS